ncbi:hypothetical protein DFH28DRAFT_971530 [Melampsora americana]|nr:hypothetical protein DFH28DRAFT_971530 [Melampsora americana]
MEVKASYLICGRDQEPVSGCTVSLRIELADETELEEIKSKLASVSCVELHSIRATQPPDPNLLRTERENIILDQIPTPLANANSNASCKLTNNDVQTTHKEDPQTSKAVKPTSDDRTKSKDTFNTKKSTSSNLKKVEVTDSAAESQVEPKKTSTTKKAMGVKQNTSKPSVEKADSKRSKSTSSLKDVKPSQSKIDQPSEQEESTKPDSKEKRTGEDVDEPNALVRKRVRKTRMVQKKKKVRVKDIRGFRVTKEEIEEVEETYTDWESDPDLESQPAPRKKAKKSLEGSEKTSNQVMNDVQNESLNPSSSQVKDEASLTEVKTKLNKKLVPKKNEVGKKKMSKDQSDLTSFFKK